MRSAALRRLCRRLHFWAGLFCAPLLLFAALTGMAYALIPQLEAWQYAALDQASAGAALPLDVQLDAALKSSPGMHLQSIIPAARAGASTQVYLAPMDMHAHHAGGNTGHDGHEASSILIVYVDPANAKVLGRLEESQRLRNWLRKLHSSLQQGNSWRWMMELGASWLLVLILSGFYLWWSSAPTAAAGRWAAWRRWHTWPALALAIFSLVIVATGLTWSRYAGGNFRALQTSLKQSAPHYPAMSAIQATGDGEVLKLQAIYQAAQQLAPGLALQFTPPTQTTPFWRAENAARSQPLQRIQMALAPRDGHLLYQSTWQDLPLLAKATAIGIPFHRGELGWWNQAILLAVAGGLAFSILSGYAMWLLRKRTGRLSAPALGRDCLLSQPRWLYPLAAVMGSVLPVLGVSLLVLVLTESVGSRRTAG
jgi:uncharacterized iron-regulated membrane protein